ncbi:MAG: glutathione S-transferase [Rhodospirillaceae bacterium]|nr:glutathione S-transferase [Rhodospirillaceae bacterium]
MPATLPVFYSFVRCPYAMRARMALAVSAQPYRHREIVLRNKPAEMISISPKATVPVLELPNGQVLDESLDIATWALGINDPQQWLVPEIGYAHDMMELIAINDGPFKHHLDRYKYANRYGADTDPQHHRGKAYEFLISLNTRLDEDENLFGGRPCLADFAIFPFVRQFANTDNDWFDGQPLNHLQKWLQAHLSSDLFKHIMQKFPPWKPGDKEPQFPI